jgi:hypothetical protein
MQIQSIRAATTKKQRAKVKVKGESKKVKSKSDERPRVSFATLPFSLCPFQ